MLRCRKLRRALSNGSVARERIGSVRHDSGMVVFDCASWRGAVCVSGEGTRCWEKVDDFKCDCTFGGQQEAKAELAIITIMSAWARKAEIWILRCAAYATKRLYLTCLREV